MNEKLNNGYAICPNSWIFDKRVQKMLPLLLLISSLSAKEGYCYASNQYLAEKFGTTPETISRQITKLKEYGYIETQDDKFGAVVTNRKIRLIALENLNQPPLTKTSMANDESINAVDENINGRYQNNQPPIDKNVNRINRLNNTSFKNTSQENYKLLKLQANNNPLPPKDISLPDFIDPNLWQEYLAYKKERREKLSTKGIEMKFSEWAKWASEGIDVNACIREAMANEWQGVFPPKPTYKAKATNSTQGVSDDNPHGLKQGTLKTMAAFRELAMEMRKNGKSDLVGDFQ
jgi:hypothetical protein|nr:MAG TPA: helix-turn-helix domain protein [Caudoviricetes sp.]